MGLLEPGMRTLRNVLAALLGISCSGCVTWSRDETLLSTISPVAVTVQVPAAWHHDAAKLELCIEVDAKYSRDTRRNQYVDPNGMPIRLQLIGTKGTSRYDLGRGTFYLQKNLSCFAIARDKETYFDMVDVSGSQVVDVRRAYWYWGHYL